MNLFSGARVLIFFLVAFGPGTASAVSSDTAHDAAPVPLKATIMSTTPMPPLTPEENRVIRDKGTERPFSGRYWNLDETGTYVCRRCGAPLYRSSDKFDAGCGWPSFDDEIPGAVERRPDPDGARIEIVCASCGGHLGHVFEGEHFTPKNTRHCVNSLSLAFRPGESATDADAPNPAGPATPAADRCSGVALFAGGCFWGVEDAFRKTPGVCEAVSGYSGGSTPDPDYEQVCGGRTGHAETVRVTFDPSRVSYKQLARLFFEIHDPTQLDRQGPDVGSQYRSAVFYLDETQKAVAEKLVAKLKMLGYPVVTRIEKAGEFYPAEDYHQRFAGRTGRGACHLRVPRFERPAANR